MHTSSSNSWSWVADSSKVLISLHKVLDGLYIRQLSAKEVDTLEIKPLGHIIGELDNLQDRGSDVGHVLEGKEEVLEELAHLVLKPGTGPSFFSAGSRLSSHS